MSETPGTDDRVKVYRDEQGEWRWKRVAPNGRIVADSAEGYTHYEDCVDGAMRQGVTVTKEDE